MTEVEFSPDGKLVATAAADGTAALWVTKSCARSKVFKGHNGPISGVSWHPSGTALALASHDRTVSLWPIGTGRHVSLRGHGAAVAAVAFSPDGKRVASGAADGSVIIWDAATGAQRVTLDCGSGDVWGLAWHPDSAVLATAVRGSRRVALWSVAAGKRRRMLPGHKEWVNGVAWSPMGKLVATASSDGTVRLFYIDNPTRKGKHPLKQLCFHA